MFWKSWNIPDCSEDYLDEKRPRKWGDKYKRRVIKHDSSDVRTPIEMYVKQTIEKNTEEDVMLFVNDLHSCTNLQGKRLP